MAEHLPFIVDVAQLVTMWVFLGYWLLSAKYRGW